MNIPSLPQSEAFNKPSLRMNAIKQRMLVSKALQERYASLVCDHFCQDVMPCLKYRPLSFGVTMPFRAELSLLPLVASLWSMKASISLPVCEGKKLAFYAYSEKTALEKDRYGLRIPSEPRGEGVFPSIVFTPLLSFDSQGYRLGYGGGYYDRYFASPEGQKTFLKIGVAYHFQKVENIPHDPHDIQLDGVITERGVEAFSSHFHSLLSQ